MTLLIGANLQTYVIVVSDTRASWQDPIKGFCFKDGDHKIVSCGLGVVTGSGYVSALNAVKEKLMATEITHTHQIINIIKQNALPKIKAITTYYPESSEQTCFLICYETVTNGHQTLRLALLHPKWDYQLGLYYDATVVMPSDSTNEEADKYRILLRDKLIPVEPNGSTGEDLSQGLMASLRENISMIGKLFYEISNKSIQVSPDMDIAIMFLDGSLIYGYGLSDNIRNGEFKHCSIVNSNKSIILGVEDSP
jgi:hypothetical protein